MMTKQLLAALAVDPNAVPHFTLYEGILRYKKRIWIGNNVDLQTQLLEALHCSAVSGHSGFLVTYRRMKQIFAWTGMKSATLAFVKSCTDCQQAKPNRAKYPGLLSPLPVPDGAWHTISLDFIEGLPRSGSADCILVVVDKFSKYSHFLPLLHPYTAAKVATVFINHVYKLHGLPAVIINNRDRVFISLFW
jgi:hypothetical protein